MENIFSTVKVNIAQNRKYL